MCIFVNIGEIYGPVCNSHAFPKVLAQHDAPRALSSEVEGLPIRIDMTLVERYPSPTQTTYSKSIARDGKILHMSVMGEQCKARVAPTARVGRT